MHKSTRSTRKIKPAKPKKPYADFPLFPHATKRWAKKIHGKVYYFGPWKPEECGVPAPEAGTWRAALDKFLDQRDDLFAGRTPRVQADGLLVKDLCNHFLTSKRHQLDTRELTQRTWDDYKRVTDKIVEAIGYRLVEDLRPEDFELLRIRLAKGNGPTTLGNIIQRARSVFLYAMDMDLVQKNIPYRKKLTRPSKKAIRGARNRNGAKLFEAPELQKLLAAATQPLKAMILLGVNCGFGNADCGRLPVSALDLEKGWVDYPRPKTEIQRRCPLWPETIDAIKEALAERPKEKRAEDASLVFLTKYGHCWFKETPDSPVAKEFAKLLKEEKLQRRGRGFYSLRHTLRTVAGDTKDERAIDRIMGHGEDDNDMGARYTEKIPDERLRAVAEYVRGWLFGAKEHLNGVVPTVK